MALGPAQVQQLLQTAKSAPRALKVIAAVAAVDIAILLFAAFLLEDDVDARIDRIAELRGQLSAQQQKISSTRKEIDRLPELRHSYDAAINSGVLADQDRLKLVELAQDLANQHRQFDLHYRLAPEIVEALAGSKFQLVSTEVTLTDGAALDGDVLAFWNEILKKSPAHYQITKFNISRLGQDTLPALTAIRSGRSGSMVKAELNFRWISLRQPIEATKLPETPKVADAAAAATPATPVGAGQ